MARSGDYLFVASSDALIEEALAVKSGKKPGLKSSDEFKRLAKGIPTEGNPFSFVSERFMGTWRNAQSQIMDGKTANNPAQAEFFKQLMNLNSGVACSYYVSANTAEGWVGIGNGTQNPAKLVLLPAVAVPAFAAGLMLPALAKAKEKAQTINCINNLKQINAAKQTWALENKKSAGDIPTWADLKPYLTKMKGGRLICPQGGTYRINAVSEAPTCSHPGHVLEQ